MKSVKLSMTLNVDLTKASDAYTALGMVDGIDIVNVEVITEPQPEAKQAPTTGGATMIQSSFLSDKKRRRRVKRARYDFSACLLYTSPSPRDATLSRMPSSA